MNRDAQRITIKDVAEKANVHFATVSLALRNSSRVSLSTRSHIKKIANELGYHPEPNLSAFNYQRSQKLGIKTIPSIALVLEANNRDPTAPSSFLDAIQDECAIEGFPLETFYLGENRISESRLNQILFSRGINAIIAFSQSEEPIDSRFDWEQFTALKLESGTAFPRLDTISPDHLAATRLAIEKLLCEGCSRIGLLLRGPENAFANRLRTLGYLTESICEQRIANVPPLATELNASALNRISRWIVDNELQAVIASENETLALASKINPGLQLVSLDWREGLPWPGVSLEYYALGKQAIQSIAQKFQNNQKGLPKATSLTVGPVKWRSAASSNRFENSGP